MGFSNEWEQLYKNNTHQSIWPWSDLISLIYRHKSEVTGNRLLELGCGAGANISLFNTLKFDYYGMDGSESSIQNLKLRFPELENKLFVGDFTKSLPVDQCDVIVDRAAVTHNSLSDIKKTVDLIYSSLKAGGLFICIDMFSTKHFEYENGSASSDEFTRDNYQQGQFVGTGKVHFTNTEMIQQLFKKFDLIHLEHKTRERFFPKSGNFASYDFIAKKK